MVVTCAVHTGPGVANRFVMQKGGGVRSRYVDTMASAPPRSTSSPPLPPLPVPSAVAAAAPPPRAMFVPSGSNLRPDDGPAAPRLGGATTIGRSASAQALASEPSPTQMLVPQRPGTSSGSGERLVGKRE